MGLQFYKLNDDQDNENNYSIKSSYTFVVGIGFLPDDPTQREIRNLRRHSIFISLSLAVIILMTSVIRRYYYLLAMLDDIFKNSITNSIINILIMSITFGSALMFYTKVMNKKLIYNSNPPQKKFSFLSLLCCCFILLGSIPLSNVITFAFARFLQLICIYPKETDIIVPNTTWEIIIYIFAWCILPAIFEELFFRGAVLNVLKKFGNMFAIISTAILSCVISGNLIHVPGLFLLGVVLGFFTIETNNILIPIAIHSLARTIFVLMDISKISIQYNNPLIIAAMTITTILGIASLFVMNKNNKLISTSNKVKDSALSIKHKQYVFFTSNSMFLLFIIILTQFVLSVELAF